MQASARRQAALRERRAKLIVTLTGGHTCRQVGTLGESARMAQAGLDVICIVIGTATPARYGHAVKQHDQHHVQDLRTIKHTAHSVRMLAGLKDDCSVVAVVGMQLQHLTQGEHARPAQVCGRVAALEAQNLHMSRAFGNDWHQ